MDRKETFRIAIQAEINSQNLYISLSKSFGKAESATIFSNLVPMEKIHEEKLRAIFESEYPGETLELELNYIPDIKSVDFNEPKNVLEFAISREEKAHAGYVKLAADTADPDLKAMLLRFAEEESYHQTILLTEIQRLQGMIQWYDPSELNGLVEY
ncbi:MAG: hypothetical protein CVU48_08615 [Candidatus Cloacimonetes bacterium HGW-Cloacimonetes-1]|jgi:rubrerythrin|nr:MAG: hypothetical protein CVU48_08615 [Candidatus Cloacimonetes bacterium HGW-Cloacimonetes-1]